jgi:hypothetical protein
MKGYDVEANESVSIGGLHQTVAFRSLALWGK